MIRSIRALGLAFLAIAAMGAFAAASAQAQEVHITTQSSAVITGSQVAGSNHVFQVNVFSTVTCTTGTFEGTVKVGETTKEEQASENGTQITTKHITITPTYSGCQAFGEPATIRMNGCKYTIRGQAALTSTAQVVGCTSGKKIEIEVPSFGCKTQVGEQAELGGHDIFANNAEKAPEKHHVQDNATVTGIVSTGEGLCPGSNNGQYKGKTTIKAFVDSGTTQVTNHSHQYTQHNCGAEVGILGT